MTMRDAKDRSVGELGRFIACSQGWEFEGDNRGEVYEWVQKQLVEWEYSCRSKKERGVIRAYLEKMTGLSVPQMTRLIRQYRRTGRIQRRAVTRRGFACKYLRKDIALLAGVDLAHERLSGPATCRILKREWEVFGKKEYERLAGLSSSHVYNLRSSSEYRKHSGHWEQTRPSPISIGARRRPETQGQPGYLRVDTVHQGDRDGQKGVYHINAVDEVTQWEVVGCTEKISEHYLKPILEAILHQFPFQIRGFHSDNGSEFINHTVAQLLNKLLVEFTKSRASRSNDNALVEGKNGAIIRKHMGYEHIGSQHAERIQKFYTAHFNVYLNYHRPCGYATVLTNARGKRKRIYKAADYVTPYEKLKSLPQAERFLKPGISFEQLDRIAKRMSDTEYARKMSQRKYNLLRACKGLEGALPRW